MNSKTIVILGIGEVGSATFEAMATRLKKRNKKDWYLYGVDINQKLLRKLRNQYKNNHIVKGFGTKIPIADVYIISVYSCEQVKSVMESIIEIVRPHKVPLIIIESTISYELAKELLPYNSLCELVLFPHRFNPGDPNHAVFNLNRTLGCPDIYSQKKAIKFYKMFMSQKYIIKTPYLIAALSKPVENAYRFIEIAIAEDLKMECDRLKVDFDKLRKATNTKWNINIKEARDGIGGSCLPKDTEIASNFFKKNTIIKNALKIDKKYRHYKEVENAKKKN